MVTKQEWLERLRQEIEEVDPQEVARAHAAGEIVLVDVREGDEHRTARVEGALHLPRGYLELRAESQLRDRTRPLVTYCAGGVRSLFAADALRRLGYESVRSMRGGFTEWKNEGLPWGYKLVKAKMYFNFDPKVAPAAQTPKD